MKNCEKSILCVYINVDELSRERALIILNTVNDNIKKEFNKNSIIEDDSLVILTIPVRNQETKIELLNARYPEYKELLNQTKDIIKKEFKNINSEDYGRS